MLNAPPGGERLGVLLASREQLIGDAAGGVLTIDLGALASNYRWIAASAAPARCGGVVKADAYGLGMDRVAPVLYVAGCRDFFVAHLPEGLDLRRLIPGDAIIYVLNGLQPGGEPACADAGLVPVLNGSDQVEAWARTGRSRRERLPAALQLDSGMSRLGLSPRQFEAVARGDLPDGLGEWLDLRLAMSHLACADEPDHPANAAQLRLFRTLGERCPAIPLSLANSGGALLDAPFRFDLVRPGVALYGATPIAGRGEGLSPVVRLDARVIQVRTLPIGAAVGYGATFTATVPTRVATVAVGYADGWSRALGNRGAAFFDGKRLPVVGRVSMDSFTIDVGALGEGALRLGSLVELIGPNQTLGAVAADCGTIPYEILTGLGRRYARRYINGVPGPTP